MYNSSEGEKSIYQCSMTKIYVIGIGYKPFDKKERKIVCSSQFILSSSRLFGVFKKYEEFEKVEDRIVVIDSVDETIEYIKEKNQEYVKSTPYVKLKTIVILASGDPLFFGIGRRVVSEFGKEMVEILPDLSSIQVAFSRIKEPWDNAFLMSLYGGPDPGKRLEHEIKDIPALLKRHRKIAILTDKKNSPAEIAKILASAPITHNIHPIMYICERLGYSDEKITKGTPKDIARMPFSTPNIVIISVVK